LVLEFTGTMSKGVIDDLSALVGTALATVPDVVVVCDIGQATRPDLSLIDALARLQLTARRHGKSIKVRNACVAARELLTLLGLADVLPLADDPTT
jgi:hypothetical protein